MMGMFKKAYDPHKELFNLEGLGRYEAIKALPKRDLHFICGFYDKCYKCPLALYRADGSGYCIDGADDFEVRTAIKYGAEFVGKEAMKNEKNT